MPVTHFASADLIPALEALAPPETFLNRTFFPRESYFVGRFCQVDSTESSTLDRPGRQTRADRQSRRERTNHH